MLSRELLKLLYLPLFGPDSKPGSSSESLGCNAIFSISSSHGQPQSTATAAATAGSSLGELDQLSALLSLTGLQRLFNLLDMPSQRRVACLLIARAVDREVAAVETDLELINSRRICSDEDMESFFGFASVLWTVGEDEEEDLTEEQCLLASAVHLVGERPRHQNTERNFLLLSNTRKRLMVGGAVVIRATFPALVFEVGSQFPRFDLQNSCR